MFKTARYYALAMVLLFASTGCRRADVPGPVHTYDIVVYGGTSAGVSAAVQARRMGKSVAVVCPETHLGGMSSNGLGFTDIGEKSAIGGLAREFYHRVYNHYRSSEAWTWQKRQDYFDPNKGGRAIDHDEQMMWVFEPHVAENIFETLVAEHDIPVYRDKWLDREDGVEKAGNKIRSIRTLSGKVFRGKVFIDATYEGDLMAAAGVDYHVGREACDVYNETWNGIQVGVLHHSHYFKQPVDPYVIPGRPSSGLLARISSEPPGEKCGGDHRIQAYCFRMCLTDVEENRVPFPEPAAYDPAQYELLLRVFETGWNEVFQKFDRIPNHKTDTNNHGPFSTDNIGMNYDYPEASYERRKEIIDEHETYQKGLMYFMSHNPGVPEEIRNRMRRWGPAKDEFTDNGHWPRQLYIREARRMTGQYVMTEHDCLGNRDAPRPVGMGSYVMDSHNVQRYVTEQGYVQNEGDIGVSVEKPYGIAYGALVPKEGQAENLLVPVCLSASHIAYGSVRMEPVFMILGQSSATAAAIAVDDNVSVQQVDYGKLKRRLLKDGQILHPAKPAETPSSARR